MIADEPLLVALVKLVDRIPYPPQPAKRGRGRPKVYSDRLFLKALVIMLIKHLSKVYELLGVLEQPTAEMRALRLLLSLRRTAGTHLGGPSSGASSRCPRRYRPRSRA